MSPKADEAPTDAVKAPTAVPYHTMTKEEAIAELGLSADIRRLGLTTSEAKARLEKFGYNQLTEKEKVTLLQRIWKQVNNVLVGILVVGCVVTCSTFEAP